MCFVTFRRHDLRTLESAERSHVIVQYGGVWFQLPQFWSSSVQPDSRASPWAETRGIGRRDETTLRAARSPSNEHFGLDEISADTRHFGFDCTERPRSLARAETDSDYHCLDPPWAPAREVLTCPRVNLRNARFRGGGVARRTPDFRCTGAPRGGRFGRTEGPQRRRVFASGGAYSSRHGGWSVTRGRRAPVQYPSPSRRLASTETRPISMTNDRSPNDADQPTRSATAPTVMLPVAPTVM